MPKRENLLADDRRRELADRSRTDIPLEFPESGPPIAAVQLPQRDQVEQDTWIVRTDLGSSDETPIRTLVRAGELIPVGLEDLPRDAA
jgi:hypothetical protein